MSGVVGYIINSVACLYIAVFVVIFCFPFEQPVVARNMNYVSLITGGFTVFVGAFWLWRKGEYEGPKMISRDLVSAKEAI